MLWSVIRLIFKTSSVTPGFFYVFHLILSFSTCSQSFKKICTWELLGANVLNSTCSMHQVTRRIAHHPLQTPRQNASSLWKQLNSPSRCKPDVFHEVAYALTTEKSRGGGGIFKGENGMYPWWWEEFDGVIKRLLLSCYFQCPERKTQTCLVRKAELSWLNMLEAIYTAVSWGNQNKGRGLLLTKLPERFYSPEIIHKLRLSSDVVKTSETSLPM